MSRNSPLTLKSHCLFRSARRAGLARVPAVRRSGSGQASRSSVASCGGTSWAASAVRDMTCSPWPRARQESSHDHTLRRRAATRVSCAARRPRMESRDTVRGPDRPGGSTLVTGMTFLVRFCDRIDETSPCACSRCCARRCRPAPVRAARPRLPRPGSGSMLLQVLLGGFAAVGVVARLYWHRLTAAVRRKEGQQEPR